MMTHIARYSDELPPTTPTRHHSSVSFAFADNNLVCKAPYPYPYDDSELENMVLNRAYAQVADLIVEQLRESADDGNTMYAYSIKEVPPLPMDVFEYRNRISHIPPAYGLYLYVRKFERRATHHEIPYDHSYSEFRRHTYQLQGELKECNRTVERLQNRTWFDMLRESLHKKLQVKTKIERHHRNDIARFNNWFGGTEA